MHTYTVVDRYFELFCLYAYLFFSRPCMLYKFYENFSKIFDEILVDVFVVR